MSISSFPTIRKLIGETNIPFLQFRTFFMIQTLVSGGSSCSDDLQFNKVEGIEECCISDMMRYDGNLGSFSQLARTLTSSL